MSDFFDLWRDTRLDSSEQFGFTMAADNPKAELVVEDAGIDWDGKRYFVDETEVIREGPKVTLEVRCNALWYRLGEIKKPGTTLIEEKSAKDGLDQLLTGTGWVSTGSTSATALKNLSSDDGTVLSLIREWADVCNGFVVFDTWNQTVDIVPERGRDMGAAFRYARNLTNIKRRASAPAITRLYAYGADDLNFAGINGGKEYVEDYSYYTDQGMSLADARARYTKSELLADTKFTDETDLLEWAREQIAELSQPEVSYECKVIDLAEMGYRTSEHRLEVGDRARVVDDPLGISVYTTVVRLKDYPLQPWRNEVELAYLYAPNRPSGATNNRGNGTEEWLLFKHDNPESKVRMDGSIVLNRIGLQFREDGEAIFGYDLNFVGVGTGSLGVTAFDAETGTILHEVLNLSYTDGQIVHENITWAQQEISGQYDFRIRAQVTSDGGPSPSSGVDFPIADSRFWVLAKGAVRQTPTNPNEAIFEFNGDTGGGGGTVQQFVVPDGVTEITAQVSGAPGGGSFGGYGSTGTGTFVVVPGSTVDVYVGGSPGSVGISGANGGAGWPNGGLGGPVRSGATTAGAGGGGASFVTPEGGSIADAWIVAPAGGGQAESAENGNQAGGNSGWFVGGDAPSWVNDVGGKGAPSQYQGGDGGISSSGRPNGDPGSFGQGGDSSEPFGTSIFSFYSGGGGGGWYGGGGGGRDGFVEGGGGGGTGWFDYERVFDTSVQEGTRIAATASPKVHGRVVITWPVPDLPS